jgi:hypothetical protein
MAFSWQFWKKNDPVERAILNVANPRAARLIKAFEQYELEKGEQTDFGRLINGIVQNQARSELAQYQRQLSLDSGTRGASLVRSLMEQRIQLERQQQQIIGSLARAETVGVPDLGFKGARQQLFQRFNLIDLYGMAHNNSTVKTALVALKQEVFRRGLTWEPAFAFRCTSCDADWEKEDLRQSNSKACPACEAPLRKPDIAQRVHFEKLMPRINVYGQSLMKLLKGFEDDVNIVDDGFIYLSSEYKMIPEAGGLRINRVVKQLFRLDPIFVEFDTDDQNRPGFAHHICLAHRRNLLDIPLDGGWEHEWRGVCPIDGYPTFPVMYRYVPSRGTFGAQRGGIGTDEESLYIIKGEMIHASKFSPSELYGYSPLLSVYEKVLSLIGMDRYLYEYFFERQMPQGVITTVTDNPEDVEIRVEQIRAEVLNNPHYLPWLAISSRNGQGKTEFTRFAYSLDELQFLPVQEALERSTAGVYGVPGLFMGFEQSYGGLNNQTQEVTRMSRGAQASQDMYNVDVLPGILFAFGITDWRLRLSSAEERTEMMEWTLKQAKASWMNMLVLSGFGAEYDQDADEYTITGSVKPQAERDKEAAAQGALNEQGGGKAGFGTPKLPAPSSTPGLPDMPKGEDTDY